MKKTEKIEVRLSHEEKNALTKLAEDEGRSISELIRGLIDRYMSIHRDKLPQKTKWGRLAIIGIGGLLIGHLGTYFMVKSHSHIELYQLGVRIQGSTINVPIARIEGETSDFIIPNTAGNIHMTAAVKKGSGALSIVEVTLCQMQELQCRELASPILSFDSRRHSQIAFGEGKDETELVLAPPPPNK